MDTNFFKTMKITEKDGKIFWGESEISPFFAVKIGEKIADWPGEYQIGDFFIRAFDGGENGLAFKISAKNVRLFVPAKKPLENEEIDFDALIVDAEKADFSAKEWKNLIEEAEPRAVIFVGDGEKTAAVKKEIGIAETPKIDALDAKKFAAEKTLFFTL